MIRRMAGKPAAWVGSALLLFGIALALTFDPAEYRTADPYQTADVHAAARIMVENERLERERDERLVWTVGALGFGLLMVAGTAWSARTGRPAGED